MAVWSSLVFLLSATCSMMTMTMVASGECLFSSRLTTSSDSTLGCLSAPADASRRMKSFCFLRLVLVGCATPVLGCYSFGMAVWIESFWSGASHSKCTSFLVFGQVLPSWCTSFPEGLCSTSTSKCLLPMFTFRLLVKLVSAPFAYRVPSYSSRSP